VAGPRLFGTFLIVGLIISSASAAPAQSAVEDAARASQAALANSQRSLNQSVSRLYRSMGAPSPLKPSENTDFIFPQRSGSVKIAPTMTREEREIFAAKQAEWGVRCQPKIVEDAEGIRRTQYAEKDCDLSQFNTAGVE
jgi:hypothetical protein